MTKVRGAQARALVQVLIDAVQPLLPPDMRIQIHGTGKRAYLTTFDPPTPDDFSASFGLHYVPFGFGSPIPFLSRGLSAKWAFIAALEAVQSVASGEVDPPNWPGPGAEVRARRDGQHIALWFELPDMAIVHVGRFDMNLGLPARHA